MRVALVFFPVDKRVKLQGLVRSLSKGIESQGHQVDVIDGSVDVGKKLTIYNYVAIVSESTGFGKIPEKINQFLQSAGNLIGKRSSAFILNSFIGSEKALTRLMKAMEKEGMYLKFSDILKLTAEAEDDGKRLHIEN
jgi:flavorubredoxin